MAPPLAAATDTASRPSPSARPSDWRPIGRHAVFGRGVRDDPRPTAVSWRAAARCVLELLRRQGREPRRFITDRLRSPSAAQRTVRIYPLPLARSIRAGHRRLRPLSLQRCDSTPDPRASRPSMNLRGWSVRRRFRFAQQRRRLPSTPSCELGHIGASTPSGTKAVIRPWCASKIEVGISGSS